MNREIYLPVAADAMSPTGPTAVPSAHVNTIIGRLRFDGPNNHGDDLSKVKQLQDGNWVVVWPKEFAAPGVRLVVR
jgi:hypothetical protein